MSIQRGRKKSSLATVTSIPGQRISPPATFTPEQADIWRAVVSTKPATWFTADTLPILADYCRHVVTLDELAIQIDHLDRFVNETSVNYLNLLLSMRDRESKHMVRLATTMRLTHQSRYQSTVANTAAQSAGDTGKPWERRESS